MVSSSCLAINAFYTWLNCHPPPSPPAVNKEQPFKDKCFLYRFRLDEEGGAPAAGIPSAEDLNAANEHIREALSALFQRGPDAILRMILRKP